MLTKFLAISLKQHIMDTLDVEIPPSQAAYRQGRSTTKHVFTTKILAGEAITSQCYTIHLMLDMFKAFNALDRTIVLKTFKRYSMQVNST